MNVSKTVCTLLLVFVTCNVGAQDFEPTVVFLYPNKLTATDEIKQALSEFETTLKITDEVRNNFVREDLAENWKYIRTSELAFIEHQDYLKHLIIGVSRELTYKETNYYDTPLIFPLEKNMGPDRIAYKKLADSLRVSWVINFLNVTLEDGNGVKTLSAQVQMYNVMTNRLFIDATFKANDSVAIEGCDKGSWLCLIEAIKTPLAESIMDKVEKNRQYHKKR